MDHKYFPLLISFLQFLALCLTTTSAGTGWEPTGHSSQEIREIFRSSSFPSRPILQSHYRLYSSSSVVAYPHSTYLILRNLLIFMECPVFFFPVEPLTSHSLGPTLLLIDRKIFYQDLQVATPARIPEKKSYLKSHDPKKTRPVFRVLNAYMAA